MGGAVAAERVAAILALPLPSGSLEIVLADGAAHWTGHFVFMQELQRQSIMKGAKLVDFASPLF